jgi:copper transport protein
VRTGRVRGVPAHPQVAVVLCVLLLASFLFDGHTAVVGPWPVIAAAAFAHTAAAAVWVGGVVLLATLLLVRARAGVPTGAGELAVRFSIPATAAVVVAGVAGVGLTALIIDSPSDLVTTSWGRVLLVKLALVAVVALMGYANNRYALPALDAWRPGTARLLRRTVAAEAAVMVAVLLTTAVLVASQA